jgi:hypothetical protein
MSLLGKVRGQMVNMGLINVESVIDENLPDTCFICNKELIDHKCESCSVDFNEIFLCPLLNENNLNEGLRTCNITKNACTNKGLEYESCDSYHSQKI